MVPRHVATCSGPARAVRVVHASLHGSPARPALSEQVLRLFMTKFYEPMPSSTSPMRSAMSPVEQLWELFVRDRVAAWCAAALQNWSQARRAPPYQSVALGKESSHEYWHTNTDVSLQDDKRRVRERHMVDRYVKLQKFPQLFQKLFDFFFQKLLKNF